jgi:hypothetical protein
MIEYLCESFATPVPGFQAGAASLFLSLFLPA